MLSYTKTRFLILILIGFCQINSHAQSLKFSDTHPVNNPDSLERWLKANHKAPAIVRLKNLITLERSYPFCNTLHLNKHHPEIQKLNASVNNPIIEASYNLLLAKRGLSTNLRQEAILYSIKSLQKFQALNDTSGLIHTHCLMATLYTRPNGEAILPDSASPKEHLNVAYQLIRTSHASEHDKIAYYIASIRTKYGFIKPDLFPDELTRGLNLSKTDPALAYAYPIFLNWKSIWLYWQNNYDQAYEIDKLLCTKYPFNLAVSYFNLGNDCRELKRYDEGIKAYEKAIFYANQCTPINYTQILLATWAMGQIYAIKGDYKKAYEVCNQEIEYFNNVYRKDNEAKLIELESLYKLAERQKEITLLKEREKASSFRNQMYTIAFLTALIVSFLIGYLALMLDQSRKKQQQTITQLSYTLEEVRQLNKSREYFIGIIAHDMRKPLISFQGLTSIIGQLIDKQLFDEIKGVSKSINNAGHQIQIMLDNLLKWALAQRESIPYHPQRLQLAETLNGVLSLFKQLTIFQTVTFTFECPDTLIVWVDPNALALIIRNLLDNALKHLPTDGHISIQCTETVTNHVQIQIKDNGQGIDTEQLPLLQNILSGKKPGFVGQNGLGLGLLLVRDFVLRNQGTITVASTAGEGSCFTICLPSQA